MDYKPECGDIFLCASDRYMAKFVMFLMQSPTLWQQIWRSFRETLEPVRFYHAGMVLNKNEIVEQQGKVQIAPLDKILSRKVIIYRYKYINDLDRRFPNTTNQNIIEARALADVGEGYGIFDVLAKTLTWLTGIKWFVTVIGKLTPNEQICINRVIYWYKGICDFGVGYTLANTKIVDEYCQSHPEEWEVVYSSGV